MRRKIDWKTLKKNISEILRLSFLMAKANFKLKNEGSYLGILWYLLNPLALFLIILFIRGQVFRVNDINNYPVYLMIGLLMFNYMTQLISSSMGIIISSGNFIKSIRIPTESLVFSRVFQSIFSHIFELLLLIFVALFFQAPLLGFVPYIIIFVLYTIFILGLCLIFAAYGVYINDLGNIWSVASSLLFFITPIFHSPDRGSLLFKLNQFNPFDRFIEAAREMFIHSKFPSIEEWLVLVALAVVSFIIGLLIFEKKKDYFAELV